MAMKELEIPMKLINLTKATSKCVQCTAKLQNGLPDRD
jgi:hypothetical protein